MADTRRTEPSSNWTDEERYWRENYRSRPYVQEGQDFNRYRPGYQYGYESANRLGRRPWNEVEPDLQRGWSGYENRGDSTWDEIKHSVKDAWDRMTGSDTSRRD